MFGLCDSGLLNFLVLWDVIEVKQSVVTHSDMKRWIV